MGLAASGACCLDSLTTTSVTWNCEPNKAFLLKVALAGAFYYSYRERDDDVGQGKEMQSEASLNVDQCFGA